MKKVFFIVLLSTFTVNVIFSQSPYTTSDKIVGKNLINGNEVSANFYDFKSPIFSNIVDIKNNTFILMFRDLKKNVNSDSRGHISEDSYQYKGNINAFDLDSKKYKWTRKIDYNKTKVFLQKDILFLSSKATTILDIKTGLTLWESPELLISNIPTKNIGLGYKDLSSNKKLLCIDMSTGEKNWTRKLKYPLALNRVMPLNDTVYIIPSRGVHTINVKTGEGWDYFSNLGLSDYQKQMSSDVSADEFYSITSIKRRRYPLSDFESNVLVDKDDVFYISKYELAKFNNQGLMKWKVPLPKETGKMFNFIYKSNIYLINTGERTYKAGKLTPENPFISAYDKENGTQKFYSDLYTKEEYIIDFNVIDDSLKLTFPNKICWFSLKKAIIVKTIEYEKDKIGSFATSINPDQIFIQSSDSALHTLIDLYPKAYFFKNWDNQVVILDSNHQLITLINPEDQYILIHENDKANFLYYNNELTVTDKKNRKIGKLDIFSSQIYFLNNHAYEIVRNMIIETDLEQYYNSIY